MERVQDHPPTLAAADHLRRVVARRRDALVGRQRKRYSAKRQAEIDRIGAEYRIVYAMALRAGLDRSGGPA